MPALSVLARLVSAALAAALTASMTYGRYTVTSGRAGAGLMPPPALLHPGSAEPDGPRGDRGVRPEGR